MTARPAPLPPPKQNRLLGIALRVGGTTSFGLMAALIKLGHEAGISTPELIFYRFAFGLPPLLAWMALTGSLGAWRTRRPLLHLSRGAIGLTTMTLAFSALAFLPLAEATAIGFAAPLFAVMLSALLLAEPVGRHRWSAVAIGFAGVLIVMQPSGSNLPPLGLALTLAAALGAAAVTITIRQMGKTESTPTTVLWFTGFSILGSGLLLPFFAEPHDSGEWLILIALGVTGGVGQLFLTSSLRFAPVPVVVSFDYAQLLWVVLLGWLIWDTHPPASTWAGAAVIVASGLYTIYREHKLGRGPALAADGLPLPDRGPSGGGSA
ncbi:MAG TPA: DMT family transporter [Allosphingosinicella sp.]|nr:DMT family transporter [Allosphingosinicella sp.]